MRALDYKHYECTACSDGVDDCSTNRDGTEFVEKCIDGQYLDRQTGQCTQDCGAGRIGDLGVCRSCPEGALACKNGPRGL